MNSRHLMLVAVLMVVGVFYAMEELEARVNVAMSMQRVQFTPPTPKTLTINVRDFKLIEQQGVESANLTGKTSDINSVFYTPPAPVKRPPPAPPVKAYSPPPPPPPVDPINFLAGKAGEISLDAMMPYQGNVIINGRSYREKDMLSELAFIAQYTDRHGKTQRETIIPEITKIGINKKMVTLTAKHSRGWEQKLILQIASS